MRFTRYPARGRRPVTPQRRKAAEKAVEKDKESVALFPELARHQSADERLAEMAQETAAYFKQIRDHHAQVWRRCRRHLRSMPEPVRQAILSIWNASWMPGSSTYLASLIRRHTLPPSDQANE